MHRAMQRGFRNGAALPCHSRHGPTPREAEQFNAVLAGFLALRREGE
jgi:hypothetical protein